MDPTHSIPWQPLRNPRAWLGCFLFWLLLTTLFYSTGAVQFEVDGRMMGLMEAPARALARIAQSFGPYPFGTMVALHLAPALWRRHGLWFWWRSAALVLGLGLTHAWFVGMLDSAWLASWVTSAVVWGFNYAGIVGGVLVLYGQRVAAMQRRELQSAQLRVLRAQLQPHFLFNTLHAIGVTAPRDGAAAARMATLLGDLLRQTLRERDSTHGLVSLAEENELLRPYLALQQIRFADRLRVDVELNPNTLGALVPDLLLQPLVENALQHGIERRPGAGHVRVLARRDAGALVIDVHDDGAGVDAAGATDGTGLGATRARLAALYGPGASLSLRRNENGGTTATLRLPWREAARAA